MPAAAVMLVKDDKLVSEFPIEGQEPRVVGRSSVADIQIRDAKLSRRHCEIRATPAGYILRDLQSRNGTFVNGARVTEARLRDGDRIQAGLTAFLFRCDEPEPGEAAETHLADTTGPHHCAACGALVPLDELAQARQTDGRVYCSACTQAEPLLGKVVAGYEIVQRIGRGPMGTVFKAAQLSMHRDVALKILHPELSQDRDAVERFLQEARAGGRCSHPNLIRIYDMNQVDNHCFIAMEFVPGGDAEALLEREGPLPVQQLLHMADQAAAGLAHAHSRSVVHRDIKPSNLLLAEDGRIKLSDLGLAKSLQAAGLSDSSSARTRVPDFAHLPPEQIDDAEPPGPRADIYSLAATCHHLLTGVPPFRADSLAELAHRIRHQPPRSVRVYRDDVPPALDHLILRAMAKEPGQRFVSSDALREALEAIQT
jgi:serine/threonine-protein kinase